jgi:hypothetical protein
MFIRNEENVLDSLKIGRVKDRIKEKILVLIKSIANTSKIEELKIRDSLLWMDPNNVGYKFKYLNGWIGITYSNIEGYTIGYSDEETTGAGWVIKEFDFIFFKNQIKRIQKIIQQNHKDKNEIIIKIITNEISDNRE